MFKKILFLLILASTLSNAQHTIKGIMKPKRNFEWIILYQLEGAKQTYMVNTTVKDGQFTVAIPKNAKPGLYRLIYNIQNRLFVDVVYNNENIELSFNPDYPSQTIDFIKSEENKRYKEYQIATSNAQQKLDSLQVAYFSTKTKSQDKKIEKIYKKQYSKLVDLQEWFEKESSGQLVYHYIKASAKYYTDKPIKDPVSYLSTIKTHFFDAIDFSDIVLLNSTLINNIINEFIFQIDNSDDIETLTNLRKKAIETVMHKIEENINLSKDIQEGLLYNFAQQQNTVMTNFILNNYYDKLPEEIKDKAFLKDIKGQLRTAVGMKVPDFTWKEKGKEKSLYRLQGFKYTMVVFWSSTCSHCLKEIPLVYNFLKERKDIQVLAIGLETEESRTGWKDETYYYPKWTHILGKNKWKNKIARTYGINATPTYIILDNDKKVLSKPYDFKEMNTFFSK